MKFGDIPAEILTVRVKQADNAIESLQDRAVLSIETSAARPDDFDLRLKDSLLSVRTVASIDTRRLNAELASGRAMLARLVNPAADGSMELQIAFFSGGCLEMGEVDIGVDEYVETKINEITGRKGQTKGERLYRLLDEHCCFRQDGSSFFFLIAGPAIDEALKPEPAVNKTSSDSDAHLEQDPETADEDDIAIGHAALSQDKQPTRSNSFCVTGDGIRFVATQTSLPEGKSIFLTTRMTKSRGRTDRALRLVKGTLRFTDWSQTGQISAFAKAQLTELTRDDVSYLKKWDEFGDLEGELLLKRARTVGALQFSDMAEKRDGTVSVRISQASVTAMKALEQGLVPEVKLIEQLPDYLEDASLRFKDFASGIERAVEKEKLLQQEERKKTNTHFKVIAFDKESKILTLKTETLPAPSGRFILSLAGEITQIKRRLSARHSISEGRAANPQLGLLVEEKGKIAPARKPPSIAPLTAFVRRKVFKEDPTPKQLEAISCALETPDIALIQGPPGTGKTTVIAAILERLNEMADKRGASIKGQVLLTGFQHDAVENMIERMSLNGLPVPKFGTRSNTPLEELSIFEKRMDEWCAKLATELRERNPQIAEIEQETEIKLLCLHYIQTPTRALGADLAEKIASLGIRVLGENGARQAVNLLNRMRQEEQLNDSSGQWLDVVRRIRCRFESFADDGPDRAADALDDLRDMLDQADHDLLDNASLWRSEDGPPPFLEALANLKKTLLVRFTTPPVFRVEKRNDAVVALAELAIKRIKSVGHTARDKRSAALAEFLAELDSNPYSMLEAVSDYSFAFAATCQQSVSGNMQKQKGIRGDDENDNQQRLEYEYVIVDEAARVSPRDLMVPMAQGKRIILVGDHRQLPHIIDEEVAGQMETGETGPSESEWLKKSMFQYLFSERLKTLEDNDKIPRRVTLDKQYRMHPTLGDFISRNFYEHFDPSEKFKSGRPASDFVHALPDTDGKPAVWLEVPAKKGKHLRRDTSWIRPAEATVISRQLRAWMDCDAGKDLSFGVISFYKAQSELIREQLGAFAENEKRLRIGTVDSFQGMEFDVVFLSTVRTLPQDWKTSLESQEKQARSLFGHLCLYNRLNVSMSRQKKLLVVVGDSGLLHGKLAAEHIPGLVDFHRLCQEQGVILQC